MKILAVDDDQIALDVLVNALIGADYQEVTAASSAERALDRLLFEQVPFDCILLDIRMPDMDGIELCRMIRSMPGYRSTPIIMITALTDQQNIDQAMAAGATDYVTKPFNGLELGARLRAASFIADMIELSEREASRVYALQTKLSDAQKHDLESAIALEPRPGIVTDLQLENGLLKLPDGVHGLQLMAFAVVNIREIYEALSVLQFRRFLESVADRILSKLNPSSANVAYVGDGTFAVVVRASRSAGTLETTIRAQIARDAYPEVASHDLKPVIVSAKPPHCDYWSAKSAASGLNECLKRVQMKCAERTAQCRLAEHRNEIRMHASCKPRESWFLNSILALKDKQDCILPKRVYAVSSSRGVVKSV